MIVRKCSANLPVDQMEEELVSKPVVADYTLGVECELFQFEFIRPNQQMNPYSEQEK